MRTPVIRSMAVALVFFYLSWPSFGQTADRPGPSAQQPPAKHQGFFDYALGKAKDIALAPQSIDVLTISPDRRRLLYSAREEASGYDLLMLEFHAAGDIRH